MRRRMERRARINGITIYDDFAHHPSAIATTLAGLRAHAGKQRIVAVLEPRSNTMRMGAHRQELGPSLSVADEVILFRTPDLEWDLLETTRALGQCAKVYDDIVELVGYLAQTARSGDHIVVMSNGSFGNIHTRLEQAIGNRRNE